MTVKSFITTIMVVAATFSVAATDLFYIEDVFIVPGQTVQVSIMLENETQYTAFQADLYLPDGLAVEQNSFALTSRKAADHTLSTSILPNGAIRLMSYSMRVNPYRGNSGALVTFKLTASDSLSTPASIALKRILFTSLTGTEAALNDTQCTVNTFLPGDVNLDGYVNIKDVTDLIDLLLSGNDTPSYADVNIDNEVNIKDITDLIDMLIDSN